MSKKIALADVLWKAANKKLAVDYDEDWCKPRYSCAAAVEAGNYTYTHTILEFLCSLGCDYSSGKYTFGQPSGHKRQGVRYMWLLIAMRVAEGEGIML